jgi:hypothetical protein
MRLQRSGRMPQGRFSGGWGGGAAWGELHHPARGGNGGGGHLSEGRQFEVGGGHIVSGWGGGQRGVSHPQPHDRVSSGIHSSWGEHIRGGRSWRSVHAPPCRAGPGRGGPGRASGAAAAAAAAAAAGGEPGGGAGAGGSGAVSKTATGRWRGGGAHSYPHSHSHTSTHIHPHTTSHSHPHTTSHAINV